MDTLLLDRTTWDLAVDNARNIAIASGSYARAQTAANVIRTFKGEAYYDTRLGVPYHEEILGQPPQIAILKAHFERRALTVPGVKSAKVYIASIKGREVRGQVQITGEDGRVAAAGF